MIQLTDQAKSQIQRLLKETGSPAKYLRIGVKGGGCSGMTYDVKIDEGEREGDRAYEVGGIKVVCDSRSLLYLDGMTIDFSTDLVGGGFRFINPNATGSCGCGTSFSV